MVSEINLSTSLENYLEAILVLERRNRVARVKDIAEYLNVQMPSVTGAVKNLREKGLINYEKNSFISLTPEGMQIARSIERRHSVLQCFLENVLLVDSEQASDIACKMEHALDTETAEKLCNSIKYFTSEILNRQDLTKEQWQEILTSRRTPCTICHSWPTL